MAHSQFFSFPQVSGEFSNGDTDLDTLLNLQKSLMHSCGVFDLPPDIALWVTGTALAAEVAEVTEPFSDLTKPWKRDKVLYVEPMKEEAIDVLHFLLQFFALLGMDGQEVMDLYVKKNLTNFERIRAKLAAD